MAQAAAPREPVEGLGTHAISTRVTIDPIRDAPEARRRVIHRDNALPIASALFLAIAFGDYVTGAEIGFTLLYLVPITLITWFRGPRLGLLFCAVSTASFLGSVVATAHMRPHVLLWNLAGEVGVYVAFTLVVARLSERLRAEIAERESVVAQLRHADRLNTVGKLASGVAHELGTPLNVVSGNADLIASGRVAEEEIPRLAGVILRQVDRMSSIIDALLAFSRRSGTSKAAADLTQVAREAVSLLEPIARKRGVALSFGSDAPLVARVDAGAILQVLTNLIMNAVQASSERSTVRVRVQRARDEVQLRVRDEGSGIPPDVLPHVFDPFFTTKEVGSGTGLGLSIAYGIVRDHRGRIEVETQVGRGTEVVVTLPTTLG